MRDLIFTEHTCQRCGYRRGLVGTPGPHQIPISLNARCERCDSTALIRAQLVTPQEYEHTTNFQFIIEIDPNLWP